MGDMQVQKFDGGMALMALTPEQAIQRHQMLVAFIKSSLKDGRDYGVIPGTDKRSLWKPGAEKLCTLFGYSVRLVPVEVERDWGGKDHNGEPFFFYEYRCEITHGAVSVVESYGNCNSFEKKYRFREGKRICPKCQKESVYRSKPRQGDAPDKPMGWYCWSKKGGCGSTFATTDVTITGQKVGLIKNDEVFDLVNTIDKMAQKRALVGSTVIACNASEFFSTEFDQEDFEDGSLTTRPVIVEDSPEVVKAKAQAASKSLRGDQGDDDLVAQAGNTRVGEFEPEPNQVIDMSNIEEIPYHPNAMPVIPQAPGQAKPPVIGSANAKLKYNRFVGWCNNWVKSDARAAKYAREDGDLANMYHILGRVAQLGYAEVTEANVEQVKTALANYVATAA